ncbi:hypothetical protein CMUST_11140 [Corynebacterium mustelae]|uniref:Uncharacterized protein n=1 Tax=Corynebacterium mustelae TaxID=571915 RepID=A0A0G3H3Y3_9CORY|nr:hypothetical protein CMUST_11140 [Corynebacterium mustelae]
MILFPNCGFHLAFLLNPCNPNVFMIRATRLWLTGPQSYTSDKFRSDTLGTITPIRTIKDRTNTHSQQAILKDFCIPFVLRVAPFVVRGSVDIKDLTHPLHRVLGVVVIDKLEADHQFVSSAKYFAALRKMSRSSRTLSSSLCNRRFSCSNCWIRSVSLVFFSC